MADDIPYVVSTGRLMGSGHSETVKAVQLGSPTRIKILATWAWEIGEEAVDFRMADI